jgi:hypothetical protein
MSTNKQIEIGSIWRHKRTGDKVKVLLLPGLYGVNYRRYPPHSNSDFNRERKKLLHYFLYEYELTDGRPLE